MNRQTISPETEIRGNAFSISPALPGSGFVINGITLHPSRVIHGEHRVDIKEGERVAFIVEHPVAVATILGIHDAIITGTRQSWDFYRASDREAHARDLPPSSVLGLADGSIGGDVAGIAERASIVASSMPLELLGVKSRVDLVTVDGNKISVEPAAPGMIVLDITLYFLNLGPLHVVLDPGKGLLDEPGAEGIKIAALRARSGAVIGPRDEALLHAAGDVIADIAGTGNIRAGKVTATLGIGYHKATIGIVKRIHAERLAVPVSCPPRKET